MRSLIFCIMFLASAGVVAAQPIVTDSRIKILVYNANEVFTVTTHYGYQANIEFGLKEEIETVSVGDRVSWQIVPAGRRLFIRAMEENAHTNMTVITNKRSYQFDLRSSASNAVYGSEELVYVVRFFYPEEGGTMPPAMAIPMSHNEPSLVLSAPTTAVASGPLQTAPSIPMGAPFPTPAASPPASPSNTSALPSPGLLEKPAEPIPAAPVTLPAAVAPAPSNTPAINYRYTYTGPSDIAPLKIFDDGTSTYFKFPQGIRLPSLAVLTASGEEISIPYQINPEGIAVVKIIAPRFSLRENGNEVVVYNEAKITG
jgi:type IV secretory pathway VirB9-like protein